MKLINDNIHGCITLNNICIKIIDTPEFQRLRDIKQLGTCNYVFPNAIHTRFEHSIGVAYLARKILTHININQPELNISESDILNVEIAGLCHDLGHCILSHAFDKKFIKDYYPDHDNIEHEIRSRMMIEYIIKKYKIIELYDKINIIQEMIHPTKYHDSFLYHIVANSKNNIDVDKFDYICRDNIAIGLKYYFDYDRIFNQCRIIDNELCFRDKEAYNLYDLYHYRYKNHKMIYNHPIVTAIEYMLIDVLKLSNDVLKLSDTILTPEKMLSNSDYIFKFIEVSNDNNLKDAKYLLNNLHKRQIYKYVGEINVEDFNKIKCDLLNILSKNNINDNDFIIQCLTIGYSNTHENPIHNIYFYGIKNKNFKFKLNINNVSSLMSQNHNEKILRLFCKSLNPIIIEKINFLWKKFIV